MNTEIEKSLPIISISCITFNHAPYIRQCIDGFLMQKTDFSFEVLIHDDASTDGTEEIIREYEAKYPDIIKPLYEKENQYIKGRKGSLVFNFPRAKGKYVALCEGDDYWTDPLKLQKQVEQMEKYPEASMCVALNKQVHTKTGNETVDDKYLGKNFPLIYFKDLNKYFHTSTYLIRKSTLDILTANYPNLFIGDTSLRYLLINEGPFVVLNEVESVYRITGTGIWTSLSNYSKDVTHYEIFNKFRIYHVTERRKFYARHELNYLHSIIIYKIRIGDYGNLSNLLKQYIYLIRKYDQFFYFKLFYFKSKNKLIRLLNKIRISYKNVHK